MVRFLFLFFFNVFCNHFLVTLGFDAIFGFRCGERKVSARALLSSEPARWLKIREPSFSSLRTLGRAREPAKAFFSVIFKAAVVVVVWKR